MKKIYLTPLLVLLAAAGYCQEKTNVAKEQKKILDSLDKEERRDNIYANRKYALSISWSPYANIAHSGSINTFGAFDICFSDRIRSLDMGHNGSLETNVGIGFQPYQGTKINLGFDYEFLSRRYKAHLYLGGQYSLGLAQANTLDGSAFVKVGFHHYLMPFIGVMWWPGKEDKTSPDLVKQYAYQHPGFRQLFFFKFQVGYACLLGKVQVDTIGAFSDHLYQVIRNNTSNALSLKLAVGINIPSFGRNRERYFDRLIQRNLELGPPPAH